LKFHHVVESKNNHGDQKPNGSGVPNAPGPARFLDPEVLARIGSLELLARAVVEGFMSGLHRLPTPASPPSSPNTGNTIPAMTCAIWTGVCWRAPIATSSRNIVPTQHAVSYPD
jgi:hypothetical protein